MSVILSLLSWFLLAMAAGGGLHTNSATAEVTITSNSAAVTAYWHTMLPNTLMPLAILELLAPPAAKDVQKSKHIWSSSTKVEDQARNIQRLWDSSTKAEDHNRNSFWGWRPFDVQKSKHKWSSSTKVEDQARNIQRLWVSSTKAEDHNRNSFWGWRPFDVQKSNGESHIGQDNHKHGTMSNMVFLEEALKPGSTIPCYILPSATLGGALLRRDVANSIPMSTGNFTEILTMFTPVSNDMATDIWSTLNDCENPRAIKGETKACVTSMESMVEFVAFVLGVNTYNLGAFSSPEVPMEGVMTGRGYKVAAVTSVREAGDTMTCHRGRFPFVMFMCHAVNPTRVYSVTLEGEDVGVDGAGQRMEVLAVCHLNTSDFHPARMPLHVKPGDAPLCHFISRDSILWALATPASAHAAA